VNRDIATGYFINLAGPTCKDLHSGVKRIKTQKHIKSS